MNSYKNRMSNNNILYGINCSRNIPFEWIIVDYNNKQGPWTCKSCIEEGTFEGVFYGLCNKCCESSQKCGCIYCRVANKDGHNRINKRMNITKIICEIKSYISILKQDYQNDEYGIVKEAIESGYYIIELHTKYQYEKMIQETALPEEVDQLDSNYNIWIWNPEVKPSDEAIEAAYKAAIRTNTTSWVLSLWGQAPSQAQPLAQTQPPAQPPAHTQAQAQAQPLAPPIKTKYQQQKEYEIECDKCKECGSIVNIKEMDCQLCLECRNPDNEPGWPLGY